MVLAVGGTDSGGAAGLTADVATIGHLGAHAACVVTAVTAQDTTGVRDVHALPLASVAAQVAAVLEDLPVAVVKTGMLGSARVVRLVAEELGHLPVVVDPVLVATSGAVLGDANVARACAEVLLPVAAVATPNLAEARVLGGHDGPARDLAARVADLGCAVVLTGGPEWRPGDRAGTCTDWLCTPGDPPRAVEHPAVRTTADHGTGCTFASALAARLARGDALPTAVAAAGAYVAQQLTTSSTWDLGRGRGPVAHTVPFQFPFQEEPR